MSHPSVVLASRSPYRAAAMRQLRLTFSVDSADIDERPNPGESAQSLALRLAEEKSRTVLARHPQAVVIGSDQVGEAAGTLLHKPGTVSAAHAQLRALSGQAATFFTALCVTSATATQTEMCVTRLRFRELSEPEITRYVALDEPLDCAGSFKVEALGISLFEEVKSNDPSGLVGLPLIALCRLLRLHGINPLVTPD